jgi:hypothetical protein
MCALAKNLVKRRMNLVFVCFFFQISNEHFFLNSPKINTNITIKFVVYFLQKRFIDFFFEEHLNTKPNYL